MEKLLWGRCNFESAMAAFYFTKKGVVQRILHEFKYHHQPDLAVFMGVFMGKQLFDNLRFRGGSFCVMYAQCLSCVVSSRNAEQKQENQTQENLMQGRCPFPLHK